MQLSVCQDNPSSLCSVWQQYNWMDDWWLRNNNSLCRMPQSLLLYWNSQCSSSLDSFVSRLSFLKYASPFIAFFFLHPQWKAPNTFGLTTLWADNYLSVHSRSFWEDSCLIRWLMMVMSIGWSSSLFFGGELCWWDTCFFSNSDGRSNSSGIGFLLTPWPWTIQHWIRACREVTPLISHWTSTKAAHKF